MLGTIIYPYLSTYLLAPMARLLNNKISAMKIIFLAIISAAVVLPAMFLGFIKVAICCLWLYLFLSNLHDALAKEQQAEAKVNIYNFMLARTFECVLLFGFYLYYSRVFAWISLIMLSGLFLSLAANAITTICYDETNVANDLSYKDNLVDRGEMFIIFTFIILFPSMYVLWGIIFTGLMLFATANKFLPLPFGKYFKT